MEPAGFKTLTKVAVIILSSRPDPTLMSRRVNDYNDKAELDRSAVSALMLEPWRAAQIDEIIVHHLREDCTYRTTVLL